MEKCVSVIRDVSAVQVFAQKGVRLGKNGIFVGNKLRRKLGILKNLGVFSHAEFCHNSSLLEEHAFHTAVVCVA